MTNKQRIFFTAEMCFGMGTIMSLLGHLFAGGVNAITIKMFIIWWGPTVLTAFLFNILVASKITNLFIKKATQKINDPALILKKTNKIRSWSMLTLMCLTMSTWGMITGRAFFKIPFTIMLIIWIRSYVLAFIIRGLIVKPLALNGMRAASRYFANKVA